MKSKEQMMEVNEYKAVIKEMLGFVHSFCVDNNIRYSVTYGTLIGTIRHNGFIPWDDDIDIWMLEEDYLKFLTLFPGSNAEYYLLESDCSQYYYNFFARVCSKSGILKMKGVIDIDNLGPFIDIFPMYKAPIDSNSRIELYKAIRKVNYDIRFSLPLRYYRTMSARGRIGAYINIVKRAKLRLRKNNTRLLKEKRRQLIEQYRDVESDYYFGAFETIFSDEWLYSYDEINTIETHIFEDIEIYIPSQYDVLLRRLYGDYMELPPVEERVSHHHFIPYVID